MEVNFTSIGCSLPLVKKKKFEIIHKEKNETVFIKKHIPKKGIYES